MKTLSYKSFSLKTHKKNQQKNKPNVCQFELTFACGLSCKHCYTNCYNKPQYIKKEMPLKEVKYILNEVYKYGILWLCFTGGDPLARKDFLDIYSYAKKKGFIITIFTNGYSMTREIALFLKNHPPFSIEITLNAATQGLYEEISQVEGSFFKAADGIKLMLDMKLPLRIKTQVTKDNFKNLPEIKKFIEKLNLDFLPNAYLHACLNGDTAPCNLRISPQEALYLKSKKTTVFDDCRPLNDPRLFHCASAARDGLHIDPYGNTFCCICIRKPKVNLLRENIATADKIITNWVKRTDASFNPECGACSRRMLCRSCPGKALLETKNLHGKINWFCELAHLESPKKTYVP
ncbi:MAG: radical SAM protein [Candidatus Omnitrophica bacterium]|nr:radical SAM protein [Candidatus Omnitrophota bacterium]